MVGKEAGTSASEHAPLVPTPPFTLRTTELVRADRGEYRIHVDGSRGDGPPFLRTLMEGRGPRT